MCDFWGRVKIRKSTVEELAAGIREVILQCNGHDEAVSREEALRRYWHIVGVRDMKRLCEEEPDLCAKMTEAEVQAQV
jgi:hypothetical protein